LATANFEGIGADVVRFWKEKGDVDCDYRVLDITTDGAALDGVA
jgi:hypothetical protein